jgi:hypothetical protein
MIIKSMEKNKMKNLTYYRTKTIHALAYLFQNKHLIKDIPKHRIYWKNYEDK